MFLLTLVQVREIQQDNIPWLVSWHILISQMRKAWFSYFNKSMTMPCLYCNYKLGRDHPWKSAFPSYVTLQLSKEYSLHLYRVLISRSWMNRPFWRHRHCWWQRIMLKKKSAKWTSDQQNVFPQNAQEIFAVCACFSWIAHGGLGGKKRVRNTYWIFLDCEQSLSCSKNPRGKTQRRT